MPRILMCRPDFYGIKYEINPWMRTRRGTDPAKSAAQWESLYQLLTRKLDAAVELIAPSPDWPDMVFTANAGLAVGQRFIASNFRYPQRAGEQPLYRQWFAEHGYATIALPPGQCFEGEGDALWADTGSPDRTLIAGYHFRSDLDSHRLLAEVLGCRIVSVELIDTRFYHLDTCFAPLGERSAVWFPPAFDDYGRRAIREVFTDLVELDEPEAARFAANAVVIGKSVVVNSGSPKLAEQLARRGFAVFDLDLSEFLKAGGAAKCLTLFLER